MEFTGKAPFKDIYIHPTVQTKEGKRMSKSLGTGINPLGLMEKYGTDALRFGLAYQTTGIQDMRFNEDVIMMGKKFANKFWNITRYVLMRLGEDYQITGARPEGREIILKFESMAKEATKDVEEYKFGEAAHLIYDFMWHDLADKFIEETKDKNDQETKDTLAYVFFNSLKLLHPFMPFITEEIYSMLPLKDKALLLVEKWPV